MSARIPGASEAGLRIDWWASKRDDAGKPVEYLSFGPDVICRHGRKWRVRENGAKFYEGRGGFVFEFDTALAAALWEQARFMRQHHPAGVDINIRRSQSLPQPATIPPRRRMPNE